MTAATHRTMMAASGGSHDRPGSHGAAGMWWVAWRQHRVTVLIALLVVVLVALAVLVFQLVLIGRLHAAGCTILTDPDACNSGPAQNAFDVNTWHILRVVLMATPVVVGVFVGAPIFPREFEQRTTVFALTQSVGRLRWWAAKITVAGAPLVAGLLGLGFLVQWCDATTWFTASNALRDGTFQVRSIMPAAFGLLTLGIAATAGVLIRYVTASLVASLIVAAGVVLIIAFPLRPHLIPATRAVTPFVTANDRSGSGSVEDTLRNIDRRYPHAWFLGSGYLDVDGHPVGYSVMFTCGQEVPQMASNAESNNTMTACLEKHGLVAQFNDYLPGTMTWPLRGVETGICLILASLFLALGAWRLPSAVSKR